METRACHASALEFYPDHTVLAGFVLEKDKKTSDLLDCVLWAVRTENKQLNADIMEAAP